MVGHRAWGAWAAALALAAGCSKARPVEGARRCESWKGGVGAALAARCSSCHAGPAPAAGYDLSSYSGALGGGLDAEPNAVAGNPGSRLLQALAPGQADATHAAFADLYSTLARWVVECDLAYLEGSVHPGGILDPAQEEFHGKLLARAGWNFDLCASCHGQDFEGGQAAASCKTCHAGGPADCGTCHGDPPATGAHAAHLAGARLQKPVACPECHVVPSIYTDAGHLFRADATVDPPPAEVRMGGRAGWSLAGVLRAGDPVYEAADRGCSNVYCHGGALADAAAARPRPRWDDGPSGASCGACHGLPPQSHGSAGRCDLCHWGVADSGQIFDFAAHLDGTVQLGDRSGACTACHGEGQDPAPPRDLFGATATDALGVGAHQSHLRAPHRLSAPIACAECHHVPDAPGSPGHVDSALPAEVFPPIEGVGELARADGAQPTWERATASCSATYCHGGGAGLSRDASPSKLRALVWTRVDGFQVVCGSCHGIPPRTPTHPASSGLFDCARCHARTVDAFGAIRFAGSKTSHLNGVVDVGF